LLELFDEELQSRRRARRKVPASSIGAPRALARGSRPSSRSCARAEGELAACDRGRDVRVPARLADAAEPSCGPSRPRLALLGEALSTSWRRSSGVTPRRWSATTPSASATLVASDLADECRRLDVALPRALLDAADPERARKLTLASYLERLRRAGRHAAAVERR